MVRHPGRARFGLEPEGIGDAVIEIPAVPLRKENVHRGFTALHALPGRIEVIGDLPLYLSRRLVSEHISRPPDSGLTFRENTMDSHF